MALRVLRRASSLPSFPSLASFASIAALVTSAGALAGCAGAASSDADSDSSYANLSPDALTAEALSSNENTAYAFFVNKGLSSEQASGIVGNLIQESTVLPTAVEPEVPVAESRSGRPAVAGTRRFMTTSCGTRRSKA